MFQSDKIIILFSGANQFLTLLPERRSSLFMWDKWDRSKVWHRIIVVSLVIAEVPNWGLQWSGISNQCWSDSYILVGPLSEGESNSLSLQRPWRTWLFRFEFVNI